MSSDRTQESQKIGRQRLIHANPFARFESDKKSEYEEAFLEMFRLAIKAENDDEETWAFTQLRVIYGTAIAEQDDQCPSFFQAMAWAVQKERQAAGGTP